MDSLNKLYFFPLFQITKNVEKLQREAFSNYFLFIYVKCNIFSLYNCRLSKRNENWYTSKSICKSNGGKLFEPQSSSINDAVVGEARKVYSARPRPIWIGFTDAISEGNWKYDSTGSSLTYTNWHSYRANRGRCCNCAFIHTSSTFNMKLLDGVCSNTYHFLCQF